MKPQLQQALPGRNDQCPCGSLKKYKKCCGASGKAINSNLAAANHTPRFSELLGLWQAAVRAFETGELARAQVKCDEVLKLDPHHAEALHLRGVIAFRCNELQTAITLVKRAIKKAPLIASFHNSLGIIQQAMGQINEAEMAYQAAIRLDANNALAHNNLGDLLQARLQLAKAEECYRTALRCQPDFAEAHNNLGNLLAFTGRYNEALAHFKTAAELRPDYFKAHYNLAKVFNNLKRYDEAHQCMLRAIEVNPLHSETWHDLSVILKNRGSETEAITAIERALQLNPEQAESYNNLGIIYYGHGLADKARTAFERAAALRPSDALQVLRLISLPGVYDSTAHLSQLREQFLAELAELEAKQLKINDPLKEIAVTPFYLAYQGENDRALLSRFADLLLAATPDLGYVAPHCQQRERAFSRGSRPADIGFISSYFGKSHIVNRVIAGVIARLPRDQFRVTLLSQDDPHPDIALVLQPGDRLIKVPVSLSEARQRIAEEKLDILFYADLGLEPWTYCLSFARLAPVQCTSGGHPVTSGVANVDYFISSAVDEITQAQQHYREQLVLLDERPYSYSPASVQDRNRTRSDFGLPEDRNFYFCPMTPFKLHPETDRLFRAILSQDADGELVFVLNHQPELWERVKARFAQTLPEFADRIRFLPFQQMEDFVALLRLADVLLDTPYFNGGTTSLEALAVGTPIVTLPGEVLRRRGTYALYNRMQMFDCVARDESDYVRLALEIAQNPERREALKQQILARNHVLFGQSAGIGQLSDFLLSALEKQSARQE